MSKYLKQYLILIERQRYVFALFIVLRLYTEFQMSIIKFYLIHIRFQIRLNVNSFTISEILLQPKTVLVKDTTLIQVKESLPT